MHIPDGFLGPSTTFCCAAVSGPLAWVSVRRVSRGAEGATAPAWVGLMAAGVFVLQMLNIAMPGGTSAHAVGTALVSIALGPWTGIAALGLVLAVQAVLFADGGVAAWGANALTMGVIPAWVAVATWRAMGGNDSPRRQRAAAFAAGWLSTVAAATATGVLLGLQPWLERGTAGEPRYFPFGLATSLPIMIGSHCLVGLLEGGVTAVAVPILLRAGVRRAVGQSVPTVAPWRQRWVRRSAAWALVVVPLGVLVPTWLGSGEAWGEWSPEETAQRAGLPSVPAGMQKFQGLWSGVAPDYAWTDHAGQWRRALEYSASAAVGGAMCLLLAMALRGRRVNDSNEAPVEI